MKSDESWWKQRNFTVNGNERCRLFSSWITRCYFKFWWKLRLSLEDIFKHFSAVLALNNNAPYIRKQLCKVSHEKFNYLNFVHCIKQSLKTFKHILTYLHWLHQRKSQKIAATSSWTFCNFFINVKYPNFFK